MHHFLKIVGNPSEIVVALTAAVALAFAFAAWRVSKKLFRHQIMNDFFREFRSPEMGVSIKLLWGFWRDCGGKAGEWDNPKVQARVVRDYMKKYRLPSSNQTNSLHNHRRRVSQFWQHISILASRDGKIRKVVYEVWKQGDLRIITELFVPIEMRGLQKELNGSEINDEEQYPRYMKDLIKLFRGADPN
jgi:hypothetical protein